jgi:two-component system, OmpR family, response regulator
MNRRTASAADIPAITRSVLIVEDDPLARGHLEAVIECAGYSVTSVASLQAARVAAAAMHYPIVIIDRMLEDGDGLALCSDLRHSGDPDPIFVLLLSVLDSPNEIAEGMRAGANAYLSKHSSDEEILAYLDAATCITG